MGYHAYLDEVLVGGRGAQKFIILSLTGLISPSLEDGLGSRHMVALGVCERIMLCSPGSGSHARPEASFSLSDLAWHGGFLSPS
jgi:hypothetical protein